MGMMLNSSSKPETPPWRTMFGGSVEAQQLLHPSRVAKPSKVPKAAIVRECVKAKLRHEEWIS